jgi:hypothetical protein
VRLPPLPRLLGRHAVAATQSTSGRSAEGTRRAKGEDRHAGGVPLPRPSAAARGPAIRTRRVARACGLPDEDDLIALGTPGAVDLLHVVDEAQHVRRGGSMRRTRCKRRRVVRCGVLQLDAEGGRGACGRRLLMDLACSHNAPRAARLRCRATMAADAYVHGEAAPSVRPSSRCAAHHTVHTASTSRGLCGTW